MSEDAVIDALTPTERWERTPRPLDYARIRLDVSSGQVKTVRDLFADERERLLTKITEAREAGAEDVGAETEVRYLIRMMNDIDYAVMEVGNGDPRPPSDTRGTPWSPDFIKYRVDRGGNADFVRDLLEDEIDGLYTELAALRGEGKSEADPAAQSCRTRLRHLIGALGGVLRGTIELVGPE